MCTHFKTTYIDRYPYLNHVAFVGQRCNWMLLFQHSCWSGFTCKYICYSCNMSAEKILSGVWGIIIMTSIPGWLKYAFHKKLWFVEQRILVLHLRCLYVCVWLADKLYLLSVTTMEKMRDEWLMEHINVCEVRLTRTVPAFRI